MKRIVSYIIDDVCYDGFEEVDEPRFLAAAEETPLHALADSYVPKFSVAMRYAFAVARKTLKQTKDEDKTINSLRSAMEETLPSLIARTVGAGGQLTLENLSLRTAGGKGSGNFAHAGRPGEVGGSMPKGDFHVVPRSAIQNYDKDGHYPLYHFTSALNLESILRLGIGETKDWDSVNMTTSLKPNSWVSWTRDPHYAVRGRDPIRLTVADKSVLPPTEAHVGVIARDNHDDFGMPAAFEHEEVSRGIISPDLITEIAVPVETYEEWQRLPAIYRGYGGESYEARAKAIEQLLRDPRIKVGLTIRSDINEEKTHYTGFRDLKAPVSRRYRFGHASPHVARWIKEHAAELVTNVTDVTRERIRALIAELAETGDWATATERITKAVGDAERAELIARHETMTAASSGQRLAWAQAIEDGLLETSQKRSWLAVGDEKTCPICSRLDGKTALLGRPYPGTLELDGPPAHVACRCTEGLV